MRRRELHLGVQQIFVRGVNPFSRLATMKPSRNSANPFTTMSMTVINARNQPKKPVTTHCRRVSPLGLGRLAGTHGHGVRALQHDNSR